MRSTGITRSYRWPIGVLVAMCAGILLSTVASAQSCPGDLNGDQQVTIDELVRGVNAALSGCDGAPPCAGDLNGDRQVTIDELVRAVNTALGGCDDPGSTATPTIAATGAVRSVTPTPTVGGPQGRVHYEFLPGPIERAATAFLAEANAQGVRGYAYRGDFLFGDRFDESGALYVKDQTSAATFRYEFIEGPIQRSSATFLAEINAQGARGFAYRGDWLFGENNEVTGALYVKDESRADAFRYEFIPGPINRSAAAFLAEVNMQGARGFAYRGDWLLGESNEETGALYVKNESLANTLRYEFIAGPINRSAAVFLDEVNTQGARSFAFRGDWLFGERYEESGALYEMDTSLPAALHYEFVPGPIARAATTFLAEVNAQGARGFAYRGDWLLGTTLQETGTLYVDRPHLGRGL